MSTLLHSVEEIHQHLPSGRILTLEGEVDSSNHSELEEIMTKLYENDDIEYLVINLRSLTYIDSGSIGIFVHFTDAFFSEGKEFVFAEANEHILDIMGLVGLTKIVKVFGTNEGAVVALSHQG